MSIHFCICAYEVKQRGIGRRGVYRRGSMAGIRKGLGLVENARGSELTCVDWALDI